MFIKELILTHLINKKVKGKYKLPSIGKYYPSSLTSNCLKQQWNYYMIPNRLGRWTDDFVLRTSEGTVWHQILEELPIFEEVEIPVKKKIRLSDSGYITISGRADAINGDTVYEFKKTGLIPAKPRFAHLLQLNWYMECLGKPKGILVYIGADKWRNFDVVEHYWTLSDFYTQNMINRAIVLHEFLTHKEAPHCSCRSKIHDIEWEKALAELDGTKPKRRPK